MHYITNAHTHLELGWLKNYFPGSDGISFGKWIGGLTNEKNKLGENWMQAYIDSVDDGITRLKDCGTTDIADISGYGFSIEPILRSGLNAIIYLEVKGISPDFLFKLTQVEKLIKNWRYRENSKVMLGLSIHSIYSTHPFIWERALNYAYKEKLPICIHAAESPAETEFALNGTGEIVDEYRELYT